MKKEICKIDTKLNKEEENLSVLVAIKTDVVGEFDMGACKKSRIGIFETKDGLKDYMTGGLKLGLEQAKLLSSKKTEAIVRIEDNIYELRLCKEYIKKQLITLKVDKKYIL